MKLSLLVNAYDDGLSTGELRRFIPNMLGPSDFRKNLANLLDLHSTEQYALQQLLEYRLPDRFSSSDVESFRGYVTGAGPAAPAWLQSLLAGLGPGLADQVRLHLARFFEYQRSRADALNFAGCSLGNLVFAGAYLTTGGDFNASVNALAKMCAVKADVVNVTRGEPRILAAIKENGEVLVREADIVGPQSEAPILDIFFLTETLSEDRRRQLEGLSVEDKRRRLRDWESPVTLSAEAARVLEQADLIVYGPGTQFSSLFPSYRTLGLPEALRRNKNARKVFVANLDRDHDIQSLPVTALLDKAFEMMSEPENSSRLITDVLYNGRSLARSEGVRLDDSDPERGTYKGVLIVRGEFENPVKPKVHSGYSVVRQLFAMREAAGSQTPTESADIYVDLLDRSQATDNLIQEFLELPWQNRFSRVRLRVNRMRGVDNGKLPPHLQVEATENSALFSDVDALLDWLHRSDATYLMTLTGDGEYRLRDVFLAREVFHAGLFGVVHGSRTQSRGQFLGSLQSAYGESRILFALSWFGAFVFSLVFGLMFRVVMSDPLTGFRIYKRSRLNERFLGAIERRRPRSAAEITKLLIQSGVEIAEIPVTYRTFAGFTRPGWRIGRGARSLLGLLG